jgi:hypothetical protein
MARTLALLRSALIRDLADLVYSYFTCGSTKPRKLAISGEWEAISTLFDFLDDNSRHVEPTEAARYNRNYYNDRILRGACWGGHSKLV